MRALDKRIQEQEQAIKTLQKEQAGVKVGFKLLSFLLLVTVSKGNGGHIQKQPEFCRCQDQGEGQRGVWDRLSESKKIHYRLITNKENSLSLIANKENSLSLIVSKEKTWSSIIATSVNPPRSIRRRVSCQASRRSARRSCRRCNRLSSRQRIGRRKCQPGGRSHNLRHLEVWLWNVHQIGIKLFSSSGGGEAPPSPTDGSAGAPPPPPPPPGPSFGGQSSEPTPLLDRNMSKEEWDYETYESDPSSFPTEVAPHILVAPFLAFEAKQFSHSNPAGQPSKSTRLIWLRQSGCRRHFEVILPKNKLSEKPEHIWKGMRKMAKMEICFNQIFVQHGWGGGVPDHGGGQRGLDLRAEDKQRGGGIRPLLLPCVVLIIVSVKEDSTLFSFKQYLIMNPTSTTTHDCINSVK